MLHYTLPPTYADDRVRPDRRQPAGANEIRVRVRRVLASKAR